MPIWRRVEALFVREFQAKLPGHHLDLDMTACQIQMLWFLRKIIRSLSGCHTG